LIADFTVVGSQGCDVFDDIRAKKLIYHLTCLENMSSIFDNGLLPRAHLGGFVDVADPKIIASRKGLCLEWYVPFHFFAKNPFDGRVQRDHPRKRFVLIAVQRSVARARGWKICPNHPLADAQIELLDYDAGMAAIDWAAMSRRDYLDHYCKCVCMAECLSPEPVSVEVFHSIYVKDAEAQAQVVTLMNRQPWPVHVDVAPMMFSK